MTRLPSTFSCGRRLRQRKEEERNCNPTPVVSLPSFLFASQAHGGERGYRSHSSTGGASLVIGSVAGSDYFLFLVGGLAQPSLCLDLLFSKV